MISRRPMRWVVFMNFWLEYIHETRDEALIP